MMKLVIIFIGRVHMIFGYGIKMSFAINKFKVSFVIGLYFCQGDEASQNTQYYNGRKRNILISFIALTLALIAPFCETYWM